MKKILIVIPYLTGKGGTETVISNFYESVIRNNYSQYKWKLVSFGGSKYESWMNKWNRSVYPFTNNKILQRIFYIIFLPLLIAYTIVHEKPDIFISTNPIMWTIAYYEKKVLSPKLKIGAWYHYSFIKKHVKKFFINKADFYWAISRGIVDELISLNIPLSKIDLIYNPIDVVNSKRVKRSGKQNHFVYIGRIDYDKQKNVSELLRALSAVKGKWICDLYGSVSKDFFKSANHLISDISEGNEINFHGFCKDVWKQVKEADVLILTSKYEGLGMVLCEAAARGIALISSNCLMGPAEIINSNNGYLYELGNYDELSHIVSNIISKKYEIPSQKKVEMSVNKFGYTFYKKRVLVSLNNRL